MPDSRDIWDALAPRVTEVEIGGRTWRLREPPLADPTFVAYAYGGELPDDLQAQLEEAAETFAGQILAAVGEHAPRRLDERLVEIRRDYLDHVRTLAGGTAGSTERARRATVGVVVLSVIDADGNQVFGWDDADRLRSDASWTTVQQLSVAAYQLAVEGAADRFRRRGDDPTEPGDSVEVSDGDPAAGSATA